MLRDIERKVLRILWNFQASRKRMPTLRELGVKSGRPERELVFILNKLAEQFYLEWDGLNTTSIKILKGWEEQTTPISLPKGRVNDFSRFME